MTDVLYAIPDDPVIRKVVISSLFEPPRLSAQAPPEAPAVRR